MMKKDIEVRILDILVRYFLIIISVFVLPLFYAPLKFLTIYSLYFIMQFFYKITVDGNVLSFLISGKVLNVEIIDACVAGSAFFLLLILNLATRSITFIKRIYLFFLDIFLLFLANIIRLIIIIPLYLNGSAFFPIAHKIFWYELSVIFVILIWLFGTWVFRIREVPVYSDVLLVLRKRKKAQ